MTCAVISLAVTLLGFVLNEIAMIQSSIALNSVDSWDPTVQNHVTFLIVGILLIDAIPDPRAVSDDLSTTIYIDIDNRIVGVTWMSAS